MTQLLDTEQVAPARSTHAVGDPSGSTPGGSAVATRSYLLCATPRTGSYLLADLLRQTGRAGRPTEYFSFGYQQHWTRRWGTATYGDYLRQVLQVGTSSNGVFGAKAHPRQLRNFARQETGTPDSTNAELRAALERWLPAPRYVWLRRRDELRQAISWAKSMQTNIWWDAQVAPAPFDQPVPDALRFDVDLLTGALVRMRREDRMWERFFAENGIAPHVVWYEDLATDPHTVFAGVVDFLRLPDLRTRTPGVSSLQRQSNETSERWIRRYVALTAARFEATFSACAGLDAGHPDMLVADRGMDRPSAWNETKHSLLAYGTYPGPFKPDYLLSAQHADGPRAGLSFVEHRTTTAAQREIVLPPRWVAGLDPVSGLGARDVRAAALAAHLGADRVGLVRDGAPAHHADVRGSRVLVIDDHDGLDIDGFLMAPPRPAHERRPRAGRLIALCVRGELPEWAQSLRNCIAMLTRHQCAIVSPADADMLAGANVVLSASGTDAAGATAIAVREATDAMLDLTIAGKTRSVPQPIDWWSPRHRPAPRADTELVTDTTGTPGRATLAGLARGAVVVTAGYGRFATAPLVAAPFDEVDAVATELRRDPDAMAERGRAGRDWLVRHIDFNADWDESWAPILASAASAR